MNNQEILKELLTALGVSIFVSIFICTFQGAPQNFLIYVSSGMIGFIGVKFRIWNRNNG